MNAIIELKDIKRDFLVGNETVHALRGVSFAIQPGEFVIRRQPGSIGWTGIRSGRWERMSGRS